MAITEFSKNYHEKMFPGYHSDFLETDPEFIERFDNFQYDIKFVCLSHNTLRGAAGGGILMAELLA